MITLCRQTLMITLQSVFLGDITKAYEKTPNLESLLFDDFFNKGSVPFFLSHWCRHHVLSSCSQSSARLATGYRPGCSLGDSHSGFQHGSCFLWWLQEWDASGKSHPGAGNFSSFFWRCGSWYLGSGITSAPIPSESYLIITPTSIGLAMTSVRNLTCSTVISFFNNGCSL